MKQAGDGGVGLGLGFVSVAAEVASSSAGVLLPRLQADPTELQLTLHSNTESYMVRNTVVWD